MIHSSKEKTIRNRSSKFTKQEVDITQTPLFFPEGYEKIFLAIYFITLPYLAGMAFQFFYIANGNTELFFHIYNNSLFILIWAIGYEIIATIILLYIIKMAIDFTNAKRKGTGKFNNEFRRP